MPLGSFEEDPYNLAGFRDSFMPLPGLVTPVEIYEVRYFADTAYDDELNPSLKLVRKIGEISFKDELVENLREKMPFECVRCDGELVYPVDQDEASEDSWHVITRCPDCELHIERIISDEEAGMLVDSLNQADLEIEEQLLEMVRADMRPYVEDAIKALNSDHIQPLDF